MNILEQADKFYWDFGSYFLRDNFTAINPVFDDSYDYANKDLPDAGRNIPNYGLNIGVIGQSSDLSVGKIYISK